MAENRYKVIVVGAGVAGSVAAVALAREGYSVLLLEQTSSLQDCGGSITLLPPASRIIVSLGLEEEFRKVVTPVRCFVSRDGGTGDIIGHTACNMGNSSIINFDAEYWNIARSDFKDILASEASKRGVRIEYNAEITEIDFETTKVSCKNGRSFKADLIVGADGINSQTRSLIPELSPVRATHWKEHTYKCLIGKTRMSCDPQLAELLDPTRMDGNSYMMAGKYVITWPIREGLPFELLASVTERASEEPGNFLSDTRYIPEVIKKFGDFCPQITKLLQLAENVTKWSIGELPDLSTWRSACGNVVLIGDAAHAMIPHAAAGASSSIEDAAVLAKVLTWATSNGKQMHHATTAFEKIRKPRTSRLQSLSRGHDGFLGASGDAAVARNATLKQMDALMWETLKVSEEERRNRPKAAMDADAPFPTQWLYGFDAIQDAHEKLRDLR